MQRAQALDKELWLQMYTVPGNCMPLGWQTTEGCPSWTWQTAGGSFLLLPRRHVSGCELSTISFLLTLFTVNIGTPYYGRFPISSNTRIIRTPLTVLKSPPENCSFSPNSHVFLSNSFLNSSNMWSTIHKLYMYSSLMNITYLEFLCAIRWKKNDTHELLHKKK